jgi:hypothetical protein
MRGVTDARSLIIFIDLMREWLTALAMEAACFLLGMRHIATLQQVDKG